MNCCEAQAGVDKPVPCIIIELCAEIFNIYLFMIKSPTTFPLLCMAEGDTVQQDHFVHAQVWSRQTANETSPAAHSNLAQPFTEQKPWDAFTCAICWEFFC